MSNEDENRVEDELMARAARLPKEVAPERDLWPQIEQSIRQPVRRQHMAWNSVWAQAAAIVLLVGGSSGITYFAVKSDSSVTGTEVVDVDNLFEPVSGDFGSQYTLGNEYLDARGQLEGNLEEKLKRLPPTSRADIVQNLNTIRIAIKDINEALANDPDNVLLQDLLLTTYHEEMALMKKINGLANSAMRREDI